VGNPFLFTGREWDSETGLYHYRARTYDPAEGRFKQRDPLGYVDGYNLYEYARSSASTYVDPWGESIKVRNYYRSSFLDDALDAMQRICPCVDIASKEHANGLYRVVTTRLKVGWTEKKFCDCIEKRQTGCRLLLDLVASDKDLTLDEDVRSRYNRGLSTSFWNRNQMAGPLFPRFPTDQVWGPVPGNPAALSPDRQTAVKDAVLAHELAHGYDAKVNGKNAENDWFNNQLLRNNSLDQREDYGTRVQNAVFQERTKQPGRRSTYDGRAVPGWNQSPLDCDQNRCKQYFESLKAAG
jgi:RHS repeat-associated protein